MEICKRAQQALPAALVGVEIVLNIYDLTKPYGLIYTKNSLI